MEWSANVGVVLDRIGIGLTWWDADGALVRASDGAGAVVGPALRPGATLGEVFGDAAGRILAAAASDGAPVEVALGERTLTVRPLRRDGELVAAVHDCTSQARLRERLRRSDEQLAEAQALTRIGSWDWEIETDSVTWSDELYRIFGLEPGAFGATAAAYLERVHPDDRATVRAAIGRAVTTGEPFDHLERILRPDGTTAVLHSRGRRATGSHGPMLYGTCRDVTEETHLREQVYRMQRMDAVGRLAGGIAHDFNNLLTVILSLADLAERRLDDPDKIREGLAGIKSAATSAAGMTRQLLTFARGESVAHDVIDVGQAVRASEHLLRRLIEEDLHIVLDVPEELGRTRIGAAQLEQVLVNLVVNARDAMSSGGTVTVRGWRATHAGGGLDAPPGDYVVLEVRDDGIGIPDEVASRVFEPLFTTKPAGQGTGLGLSTVYGIVKSAGGDVQLESSIERGTTVRVWLPRTEREPVPEREPTLSTGGSSRARLLVVEDAPPLRALLERILRDAGYRVRVAADPEAALAELGASERPPALLLTDVVLPGMSGVELAAVARERFPELPVLYMSGYPRAGQRVPQIELDDQTRFLAKPFTPDQLYTAVELALGDAARD